MTTDERLDALETRIRYLESEIGQKRATGPSTTQETAPHQQVGLSGLRDASPYKLQSGDWGVRVKGPAPEEGEVVMVRSKDGSRKWRSKLTRCVTCRTDDRTGEQYSLWQSESVEHRKDIRADNEPPKSTQPNTSNEVAKDKPKDKPKDTEDDDVPF